MKKYTNTTGEMKFVTFKDGTTQFLGRGQSVETDKEVVGIEPGVRVSEAKKIRKPVETNMKIAQE